MRETKKIAIDSEKLKAEILKHGESQKTIAEKIGIDQSTISKYISSGTISMMANMAITGLLNLPSDYFIVKPPEEVKAAEDALIQNQKLDAMIEKLDYINRNICELIDVVEKLVTTFQ